MSSNRVPTGPGAPSRTFVGRERVLGQLGTTLDEAVSGHGSLVLVAGEPGIGKTRLAQELGAHAESLGFRVLWGNCWEGAAPAFWPWIQIFRQLLRNPTSGLDPGGPEQPATAAMELTRLMPELVERFPPALTPDLPPDQARFRLFDSASTLLVEASQMQPMLLVLDDLHWADVSSLMLLKFLAQELGTARILVVAPYRDVEVETAHPMAEFAGELVGRCRHIVLEGLTPDEVGQLIAVTTGRSPSTEVVIDVYEQTGGNSFFVREMAELLAAHGRLVSDRQARAERIPMPESVRQVLQRRLRYLSAGCVEQLVAAAVLGQEFRLDVLQIVAGHSLQAQLEFLDEAVAARLVEEIPGMPTRYRFTHALIREMLCGQAGRTERAILHLRIGEAMEDRFHAHLEPHLAELASHFLQAARAGSDLTREERTARTDPAEVKEKAVQYAARAGDRALTLLAYEDAATHFTNAIEALHLRLDGMGSYRERGARRCELLLGLAAAQMAGARVTEARVSYEQAAVCARKTSAAPLLVRAALGLGSEYRVGVVDDLEIRLLEEALGALGEADSVLRARVLARLARALLFTAFQDRRTELAGQGVAIARRLGDLSALAAVLCDWHSAMWGLAGPSRRLEVATEVVELADATGQPALALQGRALCIADLLELGNTQEMRAEIDAYEAAATKLRQLRFLWQVPLLRANLAQLEGRLDDAEKGAAEALETGRRAGDQGVHISHLAFLTMLRLSVRQRVAELEAPLRQMADTYPNMPVFRAALCAVLAQADRSTEAREELECLAAVGLGNLPRDHTHVVALGMLAVACHELGDASRAATLYELLAPNAECIVRGARVAGGSLGSVAHHLGLLAVTMGRWDDAIVHLKAAISTHARMSARPHLASSLYHHAIALRARGWPEDRDRATRHLQEALTLASQLGMGALGRSGLEEEPAQAPRLGPPAGSQPRPELPQPEPSQPVALARPPEGSRTAERYEAVLRREGDYWTVAWRGATFRLRSSVGLAHLARLLGQPDRELHVLDLATPHAAGRRAPRSSSAGVGPILDDKAKAAYRRRIQELGADLEEAETWGDPERVARARAEIDELTAQLTAALGLGGHDRTGASAAERARVNVTKAIRNAIRRIGECDPVLGDHLRRSVRTGTFCSYESDRVQPIVWRL